MDDYYRERPKQTHSAFRLIHRYFSCELFLVSSFLLSWWTLLTFLLQGLRLRLPLAVVSAPVPVSSGWRPTHQLFYGWRSTSACFSLQDIISSFFPKLLCLCISIHIHHYHASFYCACGIIFRHNLTKLPRLAWTHFFVYERHDFVIPLLRPP